MIKGFVDGRQSLLKRFKAFSGAVVVACLANGYICFAEDFTDGILIINENQFGRTDSSINFLHPDREQDFWSYEIFSAANPGKFMGATNCYAAYNDNMLYVVAKSAKDPGADGTGGIVTVLDARTMELQAQLENVDPSGTRADGRAFLAIDREKGYVSTTNGIWVMDLETNTVLRQIVGSENPFGTDNLETANPACALYHGQCGMMVLCGTTVFAAHQSEGLLVIDSKTDEVTHKIPMDFVQPGAGIGSIVKDRNGFLWLSVAPDTSGTGDNLNVLVKVDPESLETEVIPLPDGIFGPATSWSSWKPDTFCASHLSNSLFWTGAANSWYANMLVYRYDIDSRTVSNIIDMSDDPMGYGWKIYQPSLRVDPVGDILYMSMYKDYASQDYQVASYTLDGTELKTYPMKKGYWFPGMMLFPASELSGIEPVKVAPLADGSLTVGYAGGTLNVTLPGGMSPCRARIIDASGRLVASVTLSAGHNSIDLGIRPGIYLLSIPSASAKFAVSR